MSEPLGLDQILAEVAARGLRVVIRPDGTPCLEGDRRQVTDALLRVLRRRRAEVLAAVAGASGQFQPDAPARPPREWRLPGGLVYRECEPLRDDLLGDHPAAADGWRFAGETDWRACR